MFSFIYTKTRDKRTSNLQWYCLSEGHHFSLWSRSPRLVVYLDVSLGSSYIAPWSPSPQTNTPDNTNIQASIIPDLNLHMTRDVYGAHPAHRFYSLSFMSETKSPIHYTSITRERRGVYIHFPILQTSKQSTPLRLTRPARDWYHNLWSTLPLTRLQPRQHFKTIKATHKNMYSIPDPH